MSQVELKLDVVQQFGTKGAHGWDFFETAQGDKIIGRVNQLGLSTRAPMQSSAYACLYPLFQTAP